MYGLGIDEGMKMKMKIGMGLKRTYTIYQTSYTFTASMIYIL